MRSHEKRVNMCPRTQGKYLVSVVLTAVFAIASLFGTLLFSTDTVADAAESQAVAQVGQHNLRERTGGDWANNVEEYDGHIASRRDGKRYDYATERRTKRNVSPERAYAASR